MLQDRAYVPIDDIDLMSLLPQYFQNIFDFQELMSTEEIELKEFFGSLQQVWNNLFIQTADEATIEYHENLLGLVPDPGDSLEIRRWRVINRYRRRPPFTLVTLYEQLNELVGVGNYEVTVDYAGRSLYVSFINVPTSLQEEAIYILITLPPAHLYQSYTTTTKPESEGFIHLGGKTSTAWIYDMK